MTRRELLRPGLAAVTRSLPADLEPLVHGRLERYGPALVDVGEELVDEVGGSLDETMAVEQVPGLAIAAMQRLAGSVSGSSPTYEWDGPLALLA
jgi:hypothetical protein